MTNRNQSARFSGKVRFLVFGLLGLVWGCGAGRAAETKSQQNSDLCQKVDDRYEVTVLEDYEKSGLKTSGGWWAWNDQAAGSTPASVSVEQIDQPDDAGNCAHTKALTWNSGTGHNDYGAGFGPGPSCFSSKNVDSPPTSSKCSDLCGAPEGSTDCKWDGLAFWVRVPLGSDATVSLTLQDSQTSGTLMGGATRTCTVAGQDPVQFKVPLNTCYIGQDTPTWQPACQQFANVQSPSDATACKTSSECPGADQACPRAMCVFPPTTSTGSSTNFSVGTCQYDYSCGTCTDWMITSSPLASETAAGWDKTCTTDADCTAPTKCVKASATATTMKCKVADFPAADCGTSKMPEYGKSRCEMWGFFNRPLACALTTPPLDSACAGWTFQVTANNFWNFVTVPFSSMAPATVDVGGGQVAPGRVFPKIETGDLKQLLPRMGNSESDIKFWVDEIDVYANK